MIVTALLKLFKFIINAILSLIPNIPGLPSFFTTGIATIFNYMSMGVGILKWAVTPVVFNAALDFCVAMFVIHNFKMILAFVRKYILFWKV